VKKLRQKKKRGRILGLLSGGKRRVFLAKGVAKMYGRQAAEKGGLEKFFQSWMPSIFV
jgi:hypothetical protein